MGRRCVPHPPPHHVSPTTDGPGASPRPRAKRVLMRGVGAGRSAQRGTSAATTGPRGARSAPPNPDADLARSAPPNPDAELARSAPPNPEADLAETNILGVDKVFASPAAAVADLP